MPYMYDMYEVKGTRAQSFESEIIHLKYNNIYISLSQERSCWISDSWKHYDNILKTCQMHENWGNPIFFPWTRKSLSLHLNGVLENILVCINCYQNYKSLPNIYGLSSSYLDFWDTKVSFHIARPLL